VNRIAMTHEPAVERLPFPLLRWFSLASLAVIGAIAVIDALLLSDFLSKRMLDREAHVTMEFVQNVLAADGSTDYLANPDDRALEQRFGNSIAHFTALQDALRNNVYGRDHKVLWSTDTQLVGQRFDDNDELDEALKGVLVVNAGRITDEVRRKPEHVGLHPDSEFFIETYIPIYDRSHTQVLGVVEIYKAPVALSAAIAAGHNQVWLTAVAGAVLLYITLYGIVRSADRTLRRQHRQLVETRTFAVVGELVSAVAHNIRNPLASIRSSAELALELKGEDCAEQLRDIVASADRIEGWMRDLLRFTRAESGPQVPVDAEAVLRETFAGFARQFERQGIVAAVDVERASTGARVRADATLLAHVLHSLIANAIDATPQHGRVEARLGTAPRGRVAIAIRDTGRGIAPAELAKVFRPFYTTKPQGFGLGLTLVRRAVDRFGGSVRIDSEPGAGTTVTLDLPVA